MGQVFQLADGSYFVSVEAPAGLYNVAQLKKIAELADQDSAIVKATEDQSLGLIVTPDQLDIVTEALNSVGLKVRHFRQGIPQPTTCLGQMCPQHQQDALSLAQSISDELAGVESPSPLRIGINGCSECCVPAHTLDVSIIGSMDGYRVSVGGKNSQIPEMATFLAESVPAEDISDRMKKLVNYFAQNAGENESLQDMVERVGMSPFIEMFAPYSQDAAETSTGDAFDLGSNAEVDDSGGEFESTSTDESMEDISSSAVESTELDDVGAISSGDDEQLSVQMTDEGDSTAEDIVSDQTSLEGHEVNIELTDDVATVQDFEPEVIGDEMSTFSEPPSVLNIDRNRSDGTQFEQGVEQSTSSDTSVSNDTFALQDIDLDLGNSPSQISSQIKSENNRSNDIDFSDDDIAANEEIEGEISLTDDQESKFESRFNETIEIDAQIDESDFEQDHTERDVVIENIESNEVHLDMEGLEDLQPEVVGAEDIEINDYNDVTHESSVSGTQHNSHKDLGHSHHSRGSGFASLELRDGLPILIFKSGIQVHLKDLLTQNGQTAVHFMIDNQNIEVMLQKHALTVSIAGVELVIPKNKAA